MAEKLAAYIKALGQGFLVGAGLAAYDRWAAGQADPLHSPLPGQGHFYDWREARVFYKAHGEGHPVLLLHSIHVAASGWEMRHVHEFLAVNGFRVYTPDLPGFGLSTRPPRRYTHDLYTRFLRDFVRDVVGQEAVVVASGITTSFVVAAAAGAPSLFGPLVLIAPVGIQRFHQRPLWGPVLEQLFRLPVLGHTMFNVLVSRPVLRWLLRHLLYLNAEQVTDVAVRYHYAVSHQPNARFAPAALLGGALNRFIRQEFAALRQPVLLVWGYRARLVPPTDGPAFLQANPRAQLTGFDARLLPHDEQADQFNRYVLKWLQARLEEAGHGEQIRLRVVM